jgi:predicted amidophosphoribosyltransferase
MATVVASGRYAGVAKDVLIALKERQALGLVPVVGGRLAVAVAVLIAARPSPRFVLVPVPSARGQVARRGHDVTLAVARAAAVRLRRGGLPVIVAPCLRHRRRVADQAGLGVSERRRNLQGAFALRGRVPTGEVIVVDDILTTGATLAEAVRVLTAAGRPPLGAATVAAPSGGRPAAVNTRTASASVAPVVTMSSITITSPRGTRVRNTNAPSRLRRRSDTPRPAWSATRRRCRKHGATTTLTPPRRSRTAAARASATVTSCPRRATCARADGTGTSTKPGLGRVAINTVIATASRLASTGTRPRP